MAGLGVKSWRSMRDTIMALFEVSDAGWSQKRVEKDFLKVSEKIERRRSSGERGGKAKSLNIKKAGVANATVLLEKTDSKTLPTINHEPEPYIVRTLLSDRRADADPNPKVSGEKRKRAPYPEAFEDFWREYPTDSLMSKKNAFERWSRLTPEDRNAAKAAIPAFRRHCHANPDYRPLHAERFISQRRFDGFNEGNGKSAYQDSEIERILALEEEARKKRMEDGHVH